MGFRVEKVGGCEWFAGRHVQFGVSGPTGQT